MSHTTVLVIGAAGDVGRGIVNAALGAGRRVVACGRDATRLQALIERHGSEHLACVAGDLSTEAGATLLWQQAQQAFDDIHDVVISVNSPRRPRPLMESRVEDLSATLADNLLTHFLAAKSILPHLPPDGLLIGIGGGTADIIFPGMAPMSMVQAALRNLYRGLARESRPRTPVRELMIVSMVNGHSSRERAKPDWLTDDDIGAHVCAILDSPSRFPDTILQLKSRAQVGQPDVPT